MTGVGSIARFGRGTSTTLFFISAFVFLRGERQVRVEGVQVSTLGEVSRHVLAPSDPVVYADVVAARAASLDSVEVDGLVAGDNKAQHFVCSSSAGQKTPSAQLDSCFLQLHRQ